MRSRKLLALLLCLITFPAIAGYMTLLGAGVGSIAPVVSWVSGTDAFPSSSLTYSGPSLSTMFDSTGKLTYKPNNLLTYSNTFSNAAWTLSNATLASGVTDPLGGTNAWTLTATGASGMVYQGPTITGPNTLFSVWIKRRTGSGAVNIRNQDGTTTVVTVTGAWTQVSNTPKASASTNIWIQMATSGDAIDIYAATMSAVTYETSPRSADQVITTSSAYYGPRIDYDPNTLAVKGLLIEEPRTNSVINNADPATWAVTGAANTTGVADPQSLTKAATVTAAAGAGYHYTSQTGATASAAQARVVSVFVKQGTAPYVNFGASGDASWHVGWMKWSDLSTGSTNGTVSVQALAGGYYRLSLAFTMTNAVPVLPYVGPDTASRATAPNYTAAGTETVVAWGLQDEPGTASTSLIITAGTAGTRQGDLITPISTFLTALQATAGTLIVQVADSEGFGATGAVIMGSSSDYWLNLLSAQVYSRSGGVNLNTSNSAVAGSPYRTGVAWAAGSRSLVLNGGTVATDSSSGLGVQSPYLGSLAGSFYLNGHITSFAMYNKKLPDNIFQAKSVLNASYANNNYKTYAFMNDNIPAIWRIVL